MPIIEEIVQLEHNKQRELLWKAALECNYTIHNDPAPNFGNDTAYCPRNWDGIMCWHDTPPGVTVRQKCADYVNKFNVTAYATKTCTANGTWFYHTEYNTTWTNYSGCSYTSPTSWMGHLTNIRLMSSIGYGVSLVSLVLAVLIMLYFKKLHCPRNTVHINLFISFILRASISFLKDSLFVEGLGLKKDVIYTDGKIDFNKEGSHWECKLIMVIFNYTLGANYMWVFVEGLYLHMLIFVSVFSERSRVHWYIVLGWGTPLLLVIPWSIVRALLEDVLCWNTHPTAGYLWIIKGPIALVILINFGFFLNIVRVLFTKLKASNTPETRNYRYSRYQGYVKLAKSTLVLIPLFGVHYIVFLSIQYELEHVNAYWELAKLYFEMFFNSFQGFLVAILFCFLNGEVRAEFRKKWHRFKIRRGSFVGGSFHNNSTYTTTHTYVPNKPVKTSQSSNSIAMNEKIEYTAVPNGTVAKNNSLSQLSTSSEAEKESERNVFGENENKILLENNHEKCNDHHKNNIYDLESKKNSNLIDNKDCIDAKLNQNSTVQRKQDNILREMDQLLEENNVTIESNQNDKDIEYEEDSKPMIQ